MIYMTCICIVRYVCTYIIMILHYYNIYIYTIVMLLLCRHIYHNYIIVIWLPARSTPGPRCPRRGTSPTSQEPSLPPSPSLSLRLPLSLLLSPSLSLSPPLSPSLSFSLSLSTAARSPSVFPPSLSIYLHLAPIDVTDGSSQPSACPLQTRNEK